MASEKQFAANRANALKSTGPVTEAGKRKASRNAVTHGLTALVHFDQAELDAIDGRAKAWADELVVDGSVVQKDLVALAVLSYHKISKGLKAQDAARAFRLAGAEQAWRVEKSKELSGYVDSIEKSPFVAVQGLQGSLVGVNWLIQSWQGLEYAFNNNAWTTDAHKRARRLMGVAEGDGVMGRCLPDIWHGRILEYQEFYRRCNEPFCMLPWEEKVLRIENIEIAVKIDDDRGDVMLDDVQPMANMYEAVMDRELERLKLIRDMHEANEAFEIESARHRAFDDVSPEGKLRQRYLCEGERSLCKYLSEIAKLTAQKAKQGRNESRNEAKPEAAVASSNKPSPGPDGAVAPKKAKKQAPGRPPTA